MYNKVKMCNHKRISTSFTKHKKRNNAVTQYISINIRAAYADIV